MKRRHSLDHLKKLFGENKTPSIPVKELKDRSTKFILDVREPDEIATGKIPGAYTIPLGDLSAREGELPKEETIYIICRSGNRSQKACEYLNGRGFRCINVAGGMLAYDGPVE